MPKSGPFGRLGNTRPMAPDSPFRESLLRVMDQKHHKAYPRLAEPGLSREQLFTHFRHEYLVYVRDFPVLLARALGQTPPLLAVRCALAENLYEEQTGGISRSAPHPELFLRMMDGLGFDRESFSDDDAWLHPAAREYRDFLRSTSHAPPWQAAVALLTIFVEGSVNERKELSGEYVRRVEDPHEHPLVRHYGCPPEALTLRKVHATVEGGHRRDAWTVVLGNVEPDGSVAKVVIDTITQAGSMWRAYRDGVAQRMALTS